EEVAQVFHVTRERVRQIERRALAKLQHPRRSAQLAPFLDNTEHGDVRPNSKPGPLQPPSLTSRGAFPLSRHAMHFDRVRSPRGADAARQASLACPIAAADTPKPPHPSSRPADQIERRRTPITVPKISAMAQHAIHLGIDRGASIAELELLGLPQRTIGMLEDSRLQIITLAELLKHSQEELLQIENLGERTIREIFDCLARYDQLEPLRMKRQSHHFVADSAC
ncbi:MAG: Bacterial polymerase, alpha chain terminal domain, partial [Planctomycetota bacterium]